MQHHSELVGHNEAEALLMSGLGSGKLAHGWIISGPKGIGKATLAYRFAHALLAPDEAAAQRIAAGSHADLLVVAPIYDEKKEEYAQDISVEQAREIGQFLSLTPGEGAWRVVIIDSIDALNVNAANAILKILEEPPPQAILLLISHNPGRLMPTIRSRCRNIRLKPLDKAEFNAVMDRVAPEVEMNALANLAALSGYSPGIALELHVQGALEVYNQILELVAALPQLDAQKLHSFADRMTAGQQHRNWQLLGRLMLYMLEALARQALLPDPYDISQEAKVYKRLAALHPPVVWAQKWQQCAEQFSLALARHLDYKQVIITFFHSLAQKEGFTIGNAA